jgi:hypothetical protein
MVHNIFDAVGLLQTRFMYELYVTVAARILFKIQDFPTLPDVLSTMDSKTKLRKARYISMARH